MFGFVGGKNYVEEYGVINLGLEDQKFAIEWVSSQIWQFGGDSKRYNKSHIDSSCSDSQ